MKAYHTLVTGSSGGGKTTLLRELHETFPGLSIWVNHSGESGVAGKRASGQQAMRSSDRNLINLQVGDADSGCELAREFAREYTSATGYPAQIIVDEAHNTSLSDGEGALKQGLHEDRDHRIKWVPATQSPQDLKESRGYPGINQCQWIVWVGTSKTFQSGFINHYNLDDAGLPEEQYKFHKILPSRPPRVVYKGETKREFA
jgi:hypothetical protein